MERELIVIVQPEAGLRATTAGVRSVAGVDVSSLADLLASENITLQPLFGASEERVQQKTLSLAETSGTDVPDLSTYYRVQAPDERLDELATRLRELDVVSAAYVKPAAEPPLRLNDMIPTATDAPPATPDFTARQGYLGAAPAGIDANYAATIPGGGGAGVKIIDIEGAWRFTHEDLTQNQGGVVGGTQSTDIGWRNHGTAVIGEFGGDRNPFGITGICPDANVRAVSIFGGPGSAGAIRQAADLLNPGDIILIELHRPGPRATGVGQQGYIAIEWWPDDFDAIRYATSRGVIVVEAAGNGAENLDDPVYNTPAPGFPATWTNPFNRANRDSGAIVVGAGAPPPGTHGRDHGPDRSRLDFSNYGSILDAQGWGREVTTCGYGDLQGGSNEDLWYTDQFSGTSSASPIVVGALGCVQGVLRQRSIAPLSPESARSLLRTTGSPQQDAPGRPRSQRIGNRPNVREMIERVTFSSLAQAMWTHGHSMEIEVPDNIARVWRAGFYIEVEGKPNTNNWFHFAIPTTVIVNDKRLRVGSVMLLFETLSADAVVRDVHIFDGADKIAQHNGVNLSGNAGFVRFDVPTHPPVKWGIGISIGVRFGGGSGSRVMRFKSAGCDFVL
ncbi:DUF6623 family protein [Microseira sp. BLCC-F43]|jgi:hypothetical protein|uniref:DUF6623 family protein n=1 Tax=Microseira sp. BLCC-F43 TaxID=3153602 RepID=UPI0035B8C21B